MATDTFAIPILDSYGKPLTSPDTLPDRWIDVPARSSGVPGLIITAVWSRTEGVVSGLWTVTQKGSGRTLGRHEFASIVAARRAAKAIADEVDWTNTAAVWGATQDTVLMERVTMAMRKEAI